MNNFNNTISSSRATYIKGLVFGVIIGILVLTGLIGIASVVFLKTGKLPNDAIEYILLAADAVAVFFAGYIAARIIKSGGLMWGAATGFSLFLILVIAGFMSGGESVTVMTLYKGVVSVIAGLVGGIKGVNRKEKIKL